MLTCNDPYDGTVWIEFTYNDPHDGRVWIELTCNDPYDRKVLLARVKDSKGNGKDWIIFFSAIS